MFFERDLTKLEEPPRKGGWRHYWRPHTAGLAVLIFLGSTYCFGAEFSGASAFKYTQTAVGFGPRPSGSAANKQLQAYIRTQLHMWKCEVMEDPFIGKTPKGDVPMTNIIAKFPGKSGHAIAVTGHFDTKLFPVNVDMIGDKSLGVLIEENSTASLRKLVWNAASELGYKAYFLNDGEKVDDDHMPFLKLGVPSLDLIDFDYEPWHKDSDTLDKLSPKSLEIVGTVVLESVHRIDRQ
jgi:hypothetical protein